MEFLFTNNSHPSRTDEVIDYLMGQDSGFHQQIIQMLLTGCKDPMVKSTQG